MRKFFIEYFNYSAKELRPLYFLVILLLLSIIIRSGISRQEIDDYTPSNEIIRKNQAFIDDLKSHQIERQSSIEVVNTKTIQPYFFDPNTIETSRLKDFGLNEKVISNLSKYRAAGGKFLQANDLKKIYGLDEELYDDIKKWISIKPLYEKNDSVIIQIDSSSNRSILIETDLNVIVFKDLIKLTGGDAKLAGRVLNYRKLLGGFCAKSQLWEVFDMRDSVFNSIDSALKIDTSLIVSLSLNNSEYSDLLRHPYLEKDDVNLIMKYRTFKNSDIDLNDFMKSKILSDSTLQKMRPYLRN